MSGADASERLAQVLGSQRRSRRSNCVRTLSAEQRLRPLLPVNRTMIARYLATIRSNPVSKQDCVQAVHNGIKPIEHLVQRSQSSPTRRKADQTPT
jgi:hypothetical protein